MNGPNTEYGNKHERLARSVLQSAHSLSSHLGIDEGHYLHVLGSAHPKSREYFLYGALDEVFRVGSSILRWSEFLRESSDDLVRDELSSRISRLALDSVFSEQQLWRRKLVETLTDLILFRGTNSQEYYSMYLHCIELDRYIRLKQDFATFYSCTNINIDKSISSYQAKIHDLKQSIDESKVWFALLSKVERGRTNFLSTTKSKFERAIKSAPPEIKLMLGISYNYGYSGPSRSIHASLVSMERPVAADDLEANLESVAQIAKCVVLLGHELMEVEPTGYANAIRNSFIQNNVSELLQKQFQPDIQTGDLVLAHGTHCIVTGVNISNYGYSSFKVRFLETPLIPGDIEDSFPANYVKLLAKREKLISGIRKVIEESRGQVDEDDNLSERISELLTDDLLSKAIRTLLRDISKTP